MRITPFTETGRFRAAAVAMGLGLAVAMGQAAPVMARAAPESFADLAEKVSGAVVDITTETTVAASAGPEMPQIPPGSPFEDFFKDFMNPDGKGPQREQHGTALGSGFVISQDGYIVTNNHVIDGADSITIEFMSGKEFSAKVVGTDPNTDIALLKVDTDEPLPFVPFGNSDEMRVGDWVMAMGNPLGQGFSVSAGIVSARGRALSGSYDDYIQTDAAINRGNSGGPLFDMDGKVIGINTAIYSPTGGNIGLGFAIPASLAEPVVAQLQSNGRVERGLLGIQIQPVTEELAQAMSLSSEKGALVAAVQPDSPALAAGLKAGDVIRSVDGKPVETIKELTRTISGMKPGSSVKLGFWRDGKDMTVTAKVGDQKDESAIIKAKADGKGEAAKPEPMAYGVSLAPISPEARQRLSLDGEVKGALVAAVEPGSPADEQGLKAGDVLQQVGRDSVDSPKAAAEKLKEARKTGKPVLMKIYREGMTRFVAISPRAA